MAQCRPNDGDASYLQRTVEEMVTRDSTWTAVADSLGIARPDPPTGVVYVTKSATCKEANTAYQKAVTGNRATLSGQVYVVQSGSSYIVWDPAYKYVAESGATIMVFNSSWVLKSKFM
jgi:hypothetical protein